jgi:microcystin-dependent protein
MGQPYVGEIRIFAGNFAPAGWAFCDGQQVAIAENETLFNLIGTTYGGDGQETFNLPDLRGRLPVHQGTGPSGTTYVIGETGGAEEVTLSTQQIPSHTHPLLASTAAGGASNPAGNVPAASPNVDLYREAPPAVQLAATAVGSVGGSQPHTNFQPYLCVDFIISLFGVYPSQT